VTLSYTYVKTALHDRLVNELRVAGIRTVAAANRYLRERFLPTYNATFSRPPADPASAFVPVGRHDLNQILCHEESRIVTRDNTVTLAGLVPDRQAARPPDLRRLTRLGAPASRRPPSRLVGPALSAATRQQGRPLRAPLNWALHQKRTDHLPTTAIRCFSD